MLPVLKVNVGDRLDEIMVRIGFAKSRSEARRLILQGAVRLGPVPDGLGEAYEHCKS